MAAGPYKFLQALPAPTTPAAPFSQPWGLGVGPAGEVFVANLGTNIVDVYNSNDEFQAEFTVAGATNVYQFAVDDSATSPSKGDVYVANLGGNVHKYTYDALTKTATEVTSGFPITEDLTEPSAVATNAAGDVYVTDFSGGYVNEYEPDGTLITKELIKGLTKPESVAVDAAGDIFVGSANGVHEYEPNGTCMNACAAFGGVEATTNGLAVGPEGDIYVDAEGTGGTQSSNRPARSSNSSRPASPTASESASAQRPGTSTSPTRRPTKWSNYAPEVVGPKQTLTVEVEGDGEVTGDVGSRARRAIQANAPLQNPKAKKSRWKRKPIRARRSQVGRVALPKSPASAKLK